MAMISEPRVADPSNENSGTPSGRRTAGTRSTPGSRPGRVRVTVYLDEVLAEWGKQQDGGLSDLLRRLLDQEKERQGAGSDCYPAELRDTYQRLIDAKLAHGLTAEQEIALARVREQIDAIDRHSGVTARFEVAAAAIDAELAELRQEIESLPERTNKALVAPAAMPS